LRLVKSLVVSRENVISGRNPPDVFESVLIPADEDANANAVNAVLLGRRHRDAHGAEHALRNLKEEK
jgi:hypothetical protein